MNHINCLPSLRGKSWMPLWLSLMVGYDRHRCFLQQHAACLYDHFVTIIQMLINQSSQMLQYCEQYPIRLLSLPSQQKHMVQRLRFTKQQRQLTHSLSPQHPHSLSLTSSQVSSVRIKPPQSRLHKSNLRHTPSPKSLELNNTIHSTTIKQNQPKKLSILEEPQPQHRLSVLKELMEKNSPFNLSKFTQKIPLRDISIIKLERLERKSPMGNETFAKIYRGHLERHRKEKELRSILIINRVRQPRGISLVIRKMASVKTVPI